MPPRIRGNESPGKYLRRLRQDANLSMRDVVRLSLTISRKRHNKQFALSLSTLHSIESREVIPGIHTLASLSEIYRQPLFKLVRRYVNHA